jgi:hypothetical protein
MLTRADLRMLSGWCHARGMTWLPGRAEGSAVGLLLQRNSGSMLLASKAGELRLFDAAGQVLAVASNLPALLDALDGGIADRCAGWRTMAPARRITRAA